MELPPYMTPKQADQMIARAARQLGEHFLGVSIAVIRTEDAGASGLYFRTAGNVHAAEKAAEEMVERSKIRRRVRLEHAAYEALEDSDSEE